MNSTYNTPQNPFVRLDWINEKGEPFNDLTQVIRPGSESLILNLYLESEID